MSDANFNKQSNECTISAINLEANSIPQVDSDQNKSTRIGLIKPFFDLKSNKS